MTTAVRLASFGLLLFACAASAQDPVARLSALREGTLTFQYRGPEDVCGDGERFIGWRDSFYGNISDIDGGDWRRRCVHGPMRVTLRKREGEVVSLRLTAGAVEGDTAGATVNLGTLSPSQAVRVLMHVARTAPGKPAARSIMAARFADTVGVWREILVVARDPGRPKAARQEAALWLGWMAGDHVLGERGQDERKKGEKQSAVFALSQLPNNAGVPDLLVVARTHRDPAVVRDALFWLGESGDPRALDLFEEMLKR